jgi:hypothetical protein
VKTAVGMVMAAQSAGGGLDGVAGNYETAPWFTR